MITELVVAFVVVAADRGFFDGRVHPLDLTVGPWMAGFGQPVVDVELSAGQFEGVGTEYLAGLDRKADFGGSRALVSGRGLQWVPLSVNTVWTV